MHPKRQFPRLFMVHMPFCLHVLLVPRNPLRSLGGGRAVEGTVTLGMFTFPGAGI